MGTRNIIGIFNEVWAGTGDRTEIPDFSEGFGFEYQVDEVPDRRNMNDVLAKATAVCVDVNKYGSVLPWSSIIGYSTGALVTAADSRVYQALLPSTNENPMTADTFWVDYLTLSSISGAQEALDLKQDAEEMNTLETYSVQHPRLPEIRPDGTVFILFTATSADNFNGSLLVYPTMEGTKSVMTYYIRSSVAPSEIEVGGNSQQRLQKSDCLLATFAAQINPLASVAVTVSNLLAPSTFDRAIGAPAVGEFEAGGAYGNGTYTLGDRKTWTLANSSEIEYHAKPDSEIMFYASSGSSQATEIWGDVTTLGTYELIETINISTHTDGGTAQGYRHKVVGAQSKVKIINVHASPCYVLAFDCDEINNAKNTHTYDSVSYWRDNQYDGVRAGWIGPGNGANDFAWAEAAGRHFGSVHGGHTSETVTLEINGSVLDDTVAVNGEMLYSSAYTLKSVSTITSDVQTYDCVSNTTILPGADIAQFEITGAALQFMQSMYMGMSVTNARFKLLQAPLSKDLSTTVEYTNTPIGGSNEVSQVDPIREDMIITKFTGHNYKFSTRKTPYVQTRIASGDYKVYNNPVSLAIGAFSAGAVFSIIREYYS